MVTIPSPMAVPDSAALGSCPGWRGEGSADATVPSQCFRLWEDTGTMASKSWDRCKKTPWF